MLLDLVSVHPSLIESHFNQVIRHVLTLLSEPLHISGLAKQVDAEESQGVVLGKSLGTKGGATGASGKHANTNSKSDRQQQPLMPILLSVLSAIFKSHGSSSVIDLSSVPSSVLNHDEHSIYNSTIIMRKKKRSFPESVWSSSSVDGVDQSGASNSGIMQLMPSLSLDLVMQFKKIWMGLEINPKALKKDTVSVMQEMCCILGDVLSNDVFSAALVSSSSMEVVSFLRVAFENFPHKSHEGLNIEKSIESDRQFRYPVVALDMSLCHLAFIVSKKVMVENNTNNSITMEGIDHFKEMNILARTYVNDTLSEIIKKSQSVSEAHNSSKDNGDKRWFALLVYLSTSRCKLFQFINDMMMDGLQKVSSSSQAQSHHIDILNVLIQLINTSISCKEYAAGNSALETKFVRPALRCVCDLLESCKFWDYFIEGKMMIHGITNNDQYSGLVCSEDMLQVGSIVELLDSVCAKTFPVWLQAGKDGKDSSVKHIDGIRRIMYSISAIFRRKFSQKILKRLTNSTVLRFFKPSTICGYDDSIARRDGSGDGDIGGINEEKQPGMYSLFDSEIKKTVIETIYYCFPYLDNTVDTVNDMLECVFMSMDSLEEPTYFLQILLHCRNAYIDGNGRDFPLHDIMRKSLDILLPYAINHKEIKPFDTIYDPILISTNTRKVLSFISEIIVQGVLAEDHGQEGEQFCLEILQAIGSSVLLPEYNGTNTGDTSWKELLIRMAAAHTIVMSAFCQRYEVHFSKQNRHNEMKTGVEKSSIPIFVTKCIELYSKMLISLFCSRVLPSEVFTPQELHTDEPTLLITDQIIIMFGDIGSIFTSHIAIATESGIDIEQYESTELIHVTPIDIFHESFLNFHETSSSWSYNREGSMSCLRVMSDSELLKRLPRNKVKMMSNLKLQVEQEIKAKRMK